MTWRGVAAELAMVSELFLSRLLSVEGLELQAVRVTDATRAARETRIRIGFSKRKVPGGQSVAEGGEDPWLCGPAFAGYAFI